MDQLSKRILGILTFSGSDYESAVNHIESAICPPDSLEHSIYTQARNAGMNISESKRVAWLYASL